jgi:predicted phosphodiesterase
MRLLILSDLHLELWRDQVPKIDPGVSQPDVVILAGDIHAGAKAVLWAAAAFPNLPVFYVHGNHEAYGGSLDVVQEQIEAACAISGNVKFLNCGEYRVGDVRFLGATLWTDFCLFGDDQRRESILQSEALMTDYKRIRLAKNGYRKLRALDTMQLHAAHRFWLRNRLAEPFHGKTVVITHMAPSMRSVPAEYLGDPVSAAFASNLDDLAAGADLWVHGHMHASCDYQIGKCRVLCNPLGYMTRGGGAENSHFDPNLVAELGGVFSPFSEIVKA